LFTRSYCDKLTGKNEIMIGASKKFRCVHHPIAKHFLCMLVGWLSMFTHQFAQSGLPTALQTPGEVESFSGNKDYVTLLSAESALKSGFPSVARSILENLLASLTESDVELFARATETLAVCYLNQGEIDRAFQQIEALADDNTRKPYLQILWAYHAGATTEELKQSLEEFDDSNLNQADQIWLDVIRVVLMTRRGEMIESRELLESIKARTSGEFQKSWIEAMVWREEILNGPASEEEVFSLKSQIENAVNPVIASQLVQQHAIVLWRSGRQQEAIRSIENQLVTLSSDYGEQRDRLLMFLALLSGNGSGKAKIALESILDRMGGINIRRMAFYTWLSNLSFDQDQNLSSLERWIEKGAADPLYYEFLYADALRKLYNGDFDSLRTQVEAIMDSEAGDQLKESSLRVLVAANWSQNPPQYRLAAEYLLRLRGLLSEDDQDEYFRITLVTGDSYYLNQDYENAIPYYLSLLESTELSESLGALIFKITDAFIQLGNLDAVGPVLDTLYASGQEIGRQVWGSEWNYILELVKNGASEQAIERLLRLSEELLSDQNDYWRFDASQRVNWMLAFLRFQNEDYQEALRICNASILAYETLADPEESSKLVYDENRLLRARALLAVGEKDQALSLLEDLRSDGNESSASASYVIEAREAWSNNPRSAQAQRALLRLAEQYPNSKYAPIALYEVALSTESRATSSSDQEAIQLFERIANDFPDHPLALISKLKQGDILRKTNQFAAAIPFYEQLSNEYADDPRAYLIDIALGECYLALGSTRSDYLDQAIRIMERIFDIGHLPNEVRIEAGTKAATGLLKANRNYRAQDLLWRVISIVYDEPETASQLGATGRYWLARACLELSQYLKQEQQIVELQRVYELAEFMKLPGTNLILN
jgi:hypothetical protein